MKKHKFNSTLTGSFLNGFQRRSQGWSSKQIRLKTKSIFPSKEEKLTSFSNGNEKQERKVKCFDKRFAFVSVDVSVLVSVVGFSTGGSWTLSMTLVKRRMMR